MKEIGIEISEQASDLINTEILNSATLSVTLCGDAADKCPMTPPHVQREHWRFDDPAGKEWSEFQLIKIKAFNFYDICCYMNTISEPPIAPVNTTIQGGNFQ